MSEAVTEEAWTAAVRELGVPESFACTESMLTMTALLLL